MLLFNLYVFIPILSNYYPKGGKMVQVNVDMPDEMVDQIKKLIDTGRYATQSELVRDALRRLFDEQLKTP